MVRLLCTRDQNLTSGWIDTYAFYRRETARVPSTPVGCYYGSWWCLKVFQKLWHKSTLWQWNQRESTPQHVDVAHRRQCAPEGCACWEDVYDGVLFCAVPFLNLKIEGNGPFDVGHMLSAGRWGHGCTRDAITHAGRVEGRALYLEV